MGVKKLWPEIQLSKTQRVNFWAEVVDQASEIEDEAALASFLEQFFHSEAQKK